MFGMLARDTSISCYTLFNRCNANSNDRCESHVQRQSHTYTQYQILAVFHLSFGKTYRRRIA